MRDQEFLADMVAMLVLNCEPRVWEGFNQRIPGPRRREALNALAPVVLEFAANLFNRSDGVPSSPK